MKTKTDSAVSEKSVSFLGCHFERAKRVEKSFFNGFLHCTHPDKSGFVPVEMTKKCELVFKNGTKFRRGFSLLEAVMATVLLGVAAAGLLIPFTSGAKVQAEGKRMVLASNLASDLLEEIIATDFDNIVDNYDGLSESRDDIESEYPDTAYSGLSRECECQYVYMPAESGTENPNFILAEVTVSYRSREMVTLRRLIAE